MTLKFFYPFTTIPISCTKFQGLVSLSENEISHAQQTGFRIFIILDTEISSFKFNSNTFL